MEALDILIKVGAGATALVTLCMLVYRLFKLCQKAYSFIHSLEKSVNRLIKHDESQYLAILRLTITNEHMPMSERLIAGKEYIDKGGNGDIKKLYNELRELCEHPDEE